MVQLVSRVIRISVSLRSLRYISWPRSKLIIGIVQWFIAATRPPSLKAIAPWEACGGLYHEQFVRGGAYDNGLFDFITQHVIRGKNGLEDFKEMYRRSKTINIYWEDKRAEIEKINIPTYVVASYSSFVSPHHIDNR